MQSAPAEENFRIPRPSVAEAQLGDVIYAGMRTPMPRSSFERWRQNYCTPFICNMVLCHGSCGDFEEHCPSFSELGRVIHLDAPDAWRLHIEKLSNFFEVSGLFFGTSERSRSLLFRFNDLVRQD